MFVGSCCKQQRTLFQDIVVALIDMDWDIGINLFVKPATQQLFIHRRVNVETSFYNYQLHTDIFEILYVMVPFHK